MLREVKPPARLLHTLSPGEGSRLALILDSLGFGI
jgi:hypothetical protein